MSRRDRAARLAGVLAPTLFVVSFLLQGLRADYDPVSQFVSELSIGPLGWIQMVTFFVTGLGYVGFGALHLAHSRAVGACFIVMGACLFASGLFTTDPSAIFDQVTPEGTVHGVLGAIVFTMFAVICFVATARLRRSGDRAASRATLVVGILLVVGIGLLKYSQLADGALFDVKGLVQRGILVLFMAWSAVYAFRTTAPREKISS